MAILMLYDKNNAFADPDIEYRGCYKKGYVVEIFDDSKSLVLPPSPPFVFLKILDKAKSELLEYEQAWRRIVDYSVIARDVVQDGWRLEVKATNANLSGKGNLTQAMVENYLNQWNAIVVDFVNYGVRFDISIYLAVTSQNFWGRNISSIVFSETSYDQVSGIHRISADYNAFPFPPGTTISQFEQTFADIVADQQGTVISNESGVIIFDIFRDDVIQRFRDDVKKVVQTTVCRRDWYFDPIFIDQIIANDRYMEASSADVVPYVKRRSQE